MGYEYSLYAGIIIFGLIAIYTDIKHNVIKNTHLIFGLAYALLIHLSYAALISMHISWKLLIIDFILAFMISFLLFVKHFWSAGDAKFFIVLCMLMPHESRVPLFLSYTLYLFINISLISFIAMLPWGINKSFKFAKLITLIHIKREIKNFLVSILVIFSTSWIIWYFFLNIPRVGPLIKTCFLFLFYWIITAIFEKFKNQTYLYIFIFIIGITLRIYIEPWIFSNKEAIIQYLFLSIKFALIFSLVRLLIKDPFSAVKATPEDTTINAPYMVMGAILAQTPLLYWLIDKIAILQKR